MNRRTLITAGLAALAASPAWAQIEALPYDQRKLVEQAAAYLQGLKTAKGRFTQTNSRGASSSGTIYLNRPGKARFEYDPQYQMLVVADGKTVAIYDRRLKTFDRYPLGATPLGIFLGRRIDLSQDVRVTGISKSATGFGVTLVDPHGNSDGKLVLEFTNQPVGLFGWTVVDQQGVETKVRMVDLTPTDNLDPALFVLADPRKAGG